jgi:hypothetical protein
VAVADNLSNEYYTTFCKFMNYLTASNLVTLLTWNSGANAVSGSFGARTYFDGTLPFGGGSHSIWKFHTNSNRNWEWYLYTQVVSGYGGGIRASPLQFNAPLSGYASTSDFIQNNNTFRGILMQAAVLVSGSSSFNPWSGSLSDGNSTAGNPRWISGALDRNLFVLPRSNDFGGATISRRDNAVMFGEKYTSTTTTMRYHFIYDGDGLVVLNDEDSNSSYGMSYVGPFELRTSLTSSGIGGGPFGFIMYSQLDALTNTITLATSFGDTAGTVSAQNGGIVLNLGVMATGSKAAINDSVGTFLGSTYQPNFVTNQYDEFPIFVGGNEAPAVGLFGALNSGLIRYAVDVAVHDTTADFSRAIFGGSAVTSDVKIACAWTGGLAPGVGASRTGSIYSWTQNYG